MILGENLPILCLTGELVDDLNLRGSFLSDSNPLGIFLNPFNPLGMFLRLFVLFNLLRVFLSFGCLCNILATSWSIKDILEFSLAFPICQEPTKDILNFFFFFAKLHIV